MARNILSLSISLVSLLACTLLSTDLSAAKRGASHGEAQQSVTEALQREIYGLDQERSALLTRALQQAPDYKPARWHQGYVEIDSQWVRVDDVPAVTAADNRLKRYHHRRGEAADTLDGQLALANWCRRQGLPDHERAHLTRVLTIDPDHIQARSRLGFVRAGDEWLSAEDVSLARERNEKTRAALASWRPKIEALKRQMHSRSPRQREYARQQLSEIEDLSAIPALEAVLAVESEDLAGLVVEVLGRLQGQEASLSLARLAVFSQFASARNSAAEQLRDRPLEEYVPTLLAALQTPIQTQREVLQGRRGRLLYRHIMFREGQDDHEIARLETSYQRVALPGGSRRDTLRRTLDDVRQRAEEREADVAQANQQTADLNNRLMHALEVGTRMNLFNSPEQWWAWWNEHNEVFISRAKPIRETVQTEQVTVVDRAPLASGPIGVSGPGASGGSGALDCLAAGTPVWTDRGQKAIEEIVVGDRVLSQDPHTGELAYKPVLQTTVRPISPLVAVRLGDEQIETSGGHLFWVAGDGWVKSRLLKSGSAIHAVDGSVPVSVVETGTRAETYNLVVADYHTYFVGASRVLCHDNTIREPTDRVVPGLAR
ncbi:MAG: hypothetical protein GTO03_18390 [Planctomycetales bacterium]|nr:hypothetical protein [Planctomycetales bacterium]